MLQPFKLVSGFQRRVKGFISNRDLKCKDLAVLLRVFWPRSKAVEPKCSVRERGAGRALLSHLWCWSRAGFQPQPLEMCRDRGCDRWATCSHVGLRVELGATTSTGPLRPKLFHGCPETGVKICLLIYVRQTPRLCCCLEYKSNGIWRVTLLG